MFGLIGFPYPTGHFDPYWGNPTSTIDWCEENYLFSPYIAELVNSFTNSMFILLALHHVYSTFKNKHDKLYAFVSIGFASVGIGSFMFHSTLQYEHQLMDELPMVWVTAIPFGHLFAWKKPEPYHSIWIFGNIIITLAFTFIYIFIFRDPIFHQLYYAILNFVLIFKTYLVIQEVIPDKRLRIRQYKLLALGFSLFAFGFLIWNLDNIYCTKLRSWRKIIGLPFGILLEGHGWWHIFTGFGIYYFIIYNMLLGTFMLGQSNDYELKRYWGIFLEVKLKEKNL